MSSQSRFLGCRHCSVLLPAPEPDAFLPADEAASVASEVADFLREHLSHAVWIFRRCEGESLSTGPLWDPMAEQTFEVTDGESTYVASCSRASLDDPRAYRFVSGELTRSPSEVELDYGSLRRCLDLEFFPQAIRPTKIEGLIEILKDRVGDLDPTHLDIAYDADDDPDLSIAAMPEDTLESILSASARLFEGWEWEKLSRFLRANACAEGALALRVRRRSQWLP